MSFNNEDPQYANLIALKLQASCDKTNIELESKFLSALLTFLSHNPHCWWCSKYDCAMDSLRLFSFGENSEVVTSFKMAMQEQLSTCQNCIDHYHKGILQCQQIYNRQYEKETVSQFFSQLENWDVQRLTSALQKVTERIELKGLMALTQSNVVACLSATFFELFKFPKYLGDQTLDSYFAKCIKLLISYKKHFSISDTILPGMVVLLFHSEEDVRNYAKITLDQRKKLIDINEFEFIRPTLKQFVFPILYSTIGEEGSSTFKTKMNVIQNSPYFIWQAFRILITNVDREVLLAGFSGFLHVVMESLKIEKQFQLFEILTCLSKFLTSLSTSSWDNQPGDYPESLLKAIVSRLFYIFSNFPANTFTQRNLSILLQWIAPFLDSVSKMSGFGSFTKLIITWLIVDIQDSTVIIAVKEHCLFAAIGAMHSHYPYHRGEEIWEAMFKSLSKILCEKFQETSKALSMMDCVNISISNIVGKLIEGIEKIANTDTVKLESSRSQHYMFPPVWDAINGSIKSYALNSPMCVCLVTSYLKLIYRINPSLYIKSQVKEDHSGPVIEAISYMEESYISILRKWEQKIAITSNMKSQIPPCILGFLFSKNDTIRSLTLQILGCIIGEVTTPTISNSRLSREDACYFSYFLEYCPTATLNLLDQICQEFQHCCSKPNFNLLLDAVYLMNVISFISEYIFNPDEDSGISVVQSYLKDEEDGQNQENVLALIAFWNSTWKFLFTVLLNIPLWSTKFPQHDQDNHKEFVVGLVMSILSIISRISNFKTLRKLNDFMQVNKTLFSNDHETSKLQQWSTSWEIIFGKGILVPTHDLNGDLENVQVNLLQLYLRWLEILDLTLKQEVLKAIKISLSNVQALIDFKGLTLPMDRAIFINDNNITALTSKLESSILSNFDANLKELKEECIKKANEIETGIKENIGIAKNSISENSTGVKDSVLENELTLEDMEIPADFFNDPYVSDDNSNEELLEASLNEPRKIINGDEIPVKFIPENIYSKPGESKLKAIDTFGKLYGDNSTLKRNVMPVVEILQYSSNVKKSESPPAKKATDEKPIVTVIQSLRNYSTGKQSTNSSKIRVPSASTSKPKSLLQQYRHDFAIERRSMKPVRSIRNSPDPDVYVGNFPKSIRNHSLGSKHQPPSNEPGVEILKTGVSSESGTESEHESLATYVKDKQLAEMAAIEKLKKTTQSSSTSSLGKRNRGIQLLDFQGVKSSNPRAQKYSRLLNKQDGAATKSSGTQIQRTTEEALLLSKSKPNMDKLYRTILNWDFIQDSNREYANIPPEMNSNSITKIPNTFSALADYVSVFEPLLTIEIWEQLMSTYSEIRSLTYNNLASLLLKGRQNVDDFIDLVFSMNIQYLKVVGDNDLIYLFKENLESKIQDNSESRFSIPSKGFLGKVSISSSNSKTNQKGVEITVRLHPNNAKKRDLVALLLDTTWSALKVTSLSTLNREFVALNSIQNYPLLHHILKPQENSAIWKQPRKPMTVEQYMKSFRLNEPQAKALDACLNEQDGFTLVQGPPGTGKSQTIVAMVGAFLSPDEHAIIVPGETPASMRNEKKKKKHLLICAPSNAAIDCIVRRLTEGVWNRYGVKFFPKIVRVGNPDIIHHAVEKCTLDYLVEREVEMGSDISEASQLRQKLSLSEVNIANSRSKLLELNRLSAKLDQLMAESRYDEEKRNLDNQIRDVFRQRKKVQEDIKSQRKAIDNANRRMDGVRIEARNRILNNADVICSTLSGSGHELFQSLEYGFDTVIIDEAAQSIEISTLIPLRYGCRHCILVGDPNQLPPTVISMTAQKYYYNRSLFERLQHSLKSNVHLLSIQYRMHPEISLFPSKLFYDSKLTDAPTMLRKQSREWHQHWMFRPYLFFNVHNGKESRHHGKSYYNEQEGEIAVALVASLCGRYKDFNFFSKIGIITPYKQQLRMLERMFIAKFGTGILDAIDINTVDGFQGQEKDIIILTCVRVGEERPGGGIGFVSDVRRLNVSITRAKSSLFILGHSNTLQKHSLWRNLIHNAKERGVHINVAIDDFTEIPPKYSYNNLLTTSTRTPL